MSSLFFPQLSSGAVAQYPIKKTRLVRTVKNLLQDGSVLVSSDPGGARVIWQMVYLDLALQDLQLLQGHFTSCVGPYHAFTFIDPTDNMLVSSSNVSLASVPVSGTNVPAWHNSTLIQIEPGIADPNGGTAAFMATNTAQASQEISQTLTGPTNAVPANYQYCFSIYARSAAPAQLVLTRGGTSDSQSMTFSIGAGWSRLVSSGRLNDSGVSFTVAVSLAPGQQVSLYGPQLEAQISPSRYRPTIGSGGIYANAHWGVDQLAVSATAPNLYSTSFTIETAV